MTIARRKSKNVSDENSEQAQPMNVNINIACSVDPKTGASRCRILYPNPVLVRGHAPLEEMEDQIESERKRDQEFEEYQNMEAEEVAKERYHKKLLKHNPKTEVEEEDHDDDGDTEDSKDYDGEVDPVDDPENSEDDVVPDRVTRSTMKKR
jgi:hypothetical protein